MGEGESGGKQGNRSKLLEKNYEKLVRRETEVGEMLMNPPVNGSGGKSYNFPLEKRLVVADFMAAMMATMFGLSMEANSLEKRYLS